MDDGEWQFRAFWAHDRDEEGGAMRDLLNLLVERMRRYPGAHIYHYANYEIAALRRLTAAHRTGEAAMDQLQREQRFVDLYKVVCGGLYRAEERRVGKSVSVRLDPGGCRIIRKKKR